jgi:DNA-binding response OmpR family regulator
MYENWTYVIVSEPDSGTLEMDLELCEMYKEVNNRILLVEDDADTRFALAMLFEMEGYFVITAADGEEALGRAIGDAPALIVTDINLPKLNGLDLIVKLGADSRTQHIPVVAMSAVEKQHLGRALELGAVAVFQKPLEFDQFISLIAGLVSAHLMRSRAQSQNERRRNPWPDPDGDRKLNNNSRAAQRDG